MDKRYRIECYIHVPDESEEQEVYNSKEWAEQDARELEEMYSGNIYRVEEIDN